MHLEPVQLIENWWSDKNRRFWWLLLLLLLLSFLVLPKRIDGIGWLPQGKATVQVRINSIPCWGNALGTSAIDRKLMERQKSTIFVVVVVVAVALFPCTSKTNRWYWETTTGEGDCADANKFDRLCRQCTWNQCNWSKIDGATKIDDFCCCCCCGCCHSFVLFHQNESRVVGGLQQ